jgi:hypothetical protein
MVGGFVFLAIVFFAYRCGQKSQHAVIPDKRIQNSVTNVAL